jgi:UPF0716 protein FxsA
MVFLWFLLFLAWPVAEIWVFIELGRSIGWLWAILLTIATSLAGSVLMRIQGVSALNRFLESAERGELPVATVLDAVGIFIAGVLLMLPGFLTDIIGLLLFIPPLRRGLTAWLFRQILQSPASREGIRRGGFGRRPAASPKEGFRKSDNVVDAEFETLEPGPKTPRTPPLVNRPDKE